MEQTPSDGGKQQPERPRVQRFQFGVWLFSVNRAQELLAEQPREPVKLPVAPWARFYSLETPKDASSVPLFAPGSGFNRDYAMTTDLSSPLIVATLRNRDTEEEFPLLIDGTHRLYRAYTERVSDLPAYVLNADESLAIREDAYYR